MNYIDYEDTLEYVIVTTEGETEEMGGQYKYIYAKGRLIKVSKKVIQKAIKIAKKAKKYIT